MAGAVDSWAAMRRGEVLKVLQRLQHAKKCGCGLFGRNIMREKEIEMKLVRAAKAAGGICPKLVCPGFDGMPDRIVLMPEARIGFVEVKAPGKKPRPLQVRRHEQLAALGFKVYVLDSAKQIPGIIREIGGNDGDVDHDAGRRN